MAGLPGIIRRISAWIPGIALCVCVVCGVAVGQPEPQADSKDLCKIYPLYCTALEAAQTLDETIDPDAAIQNFHQLACEIQDRVDPDASPREKIETIAEFLFEEKGFGIKQEENYVPLQKYGIHIFTDPRGCCMSLSLLYMELGRSLGLRTGFVNIFSSNPHVFVKFILPEEPIYVETTAKGTIIPDFVQFIIDYQASSPYEILDYKTFGAVIWNTSANKHAENGEFSKSIVQHKKSLDIYPKFAHAYASLGQTYEWMGDYDTALMNYRKAVAIRPDHADAQVNIGKMLIYQNDIDGAIKATQKALEISPTIATAHCNMGMLLLKQGFVDQGLQHYKKAVRSDPFLMEAHYNLGLYYYEQKEYTEAAAAFEIAIRSEPSRAEIYYMLGGCYVNMDRPKSALKVLEQAMNLFPDNASLHFVMAWAYLKNGNIEEALAAKERCEELGGKIPASFTAELEKYTQQSESGE